MSSGGSLSTKGLVSSGGAVQYRMRGFDSTLAMIVFWTVPEIDPTAAEYPGPGPVSDIVVQAAVGQEIIL